jgi:hypothetical protein
MAIRLTYRTEKDGRGEYLVVDAEHTDCGKSFRGVAFVFEHKSVNPTLSIHVPLGFGAVQQIITDVSRGEAV